MEREGKAGRKKRRTGKKRGKKERGKRKVLLKKKRRRIRYCRWRRSAAVGEAESGDQIAGERKGMCEREDCIWRGKGSC